MTPTHPKSTEEPEFVLLSVVWFADGTGQPTVLARGTREQCQRAQSLVPGVSYSGDKAVTDATMCVMTAAEMAACIEDAEVK